MTSTAGSTDKDAERPLQTLLDKALEQADGDRLKVGDLLDAYGTRSFGPVIALLALIVISPLGAVPFLPILFAALILLIAVQILFGRKHPWVPDRIRKIAFDRKKAEAFREKSGDWLKRIDKLIGPRLEWAATGPADYAAALAVCFLCLILGAPPIELIPYAAALPASAILMFGLGLTARDGLLMILGYLITAGATVAGYMWIFGGKEQGEQSAALLGAGIAFA